MHERDRDDKLARAAGGGARTAQRLGLPTAAAMIVNVGTTNSCTLTGAGKYGTVRFTFKTSHGAVDSASVKPSS